jgi:hypothetical protein
MHHRIEMRTELQIQASRANGAKSHGPQTPEGKQASSRNAMTHGLLSGTVVRRRIGRTFEALFSAVLEELQPQTPVEHSLVENMTVARWRQLRIRGMEKASMEYEISRRAEASPTPADNATIAALAFRALSDDSRSLKLINRYEARYDRQYLGAHRRTPPAAEPPQPETRAESADVASAILQRRDRSRTRQRFQPQQFQNFYFCRRTQARQSNRCNINNHVRQPPCLRSHHKILWKSRGKPIMGYTCYFTSPETGVSMVKRSGCGTGFSLWKRRPFRPRPTSQGQGIEVSFC